MLQDYLEYHNYELVEVLEEKGVMMDMISLDTIMGLFTNMMPLEYSSLFFDNFFRYGWKFFYSLFLVFMEEIQDDLMNEEYTFLEIIKIFKIYSNSIPKLPKPKPDSSPK